MPVDKFGRSPKTRSQNVTNVGGVSHEYLNINFLQKGQAIDMPGQNILNLGSSQGPVDAVRKKYVNERFFKRGDPIDINKKAIKNVLSPIDGGDVVNKSYVDSKMLVKVICSDVLESFVESESQALRVRVIKNFSSQCQSHDPVDRVRVETQKLSSYFESLVCKLESMSSHMKFHIFSITFFMP